MKKNVIIPVDFALLDLGAEEANPFILITGVEVNDDGSLYDQDLARKAMASEAVSKGATRINESDCVDTDTGGTESYNDSLVVFNGGDIYAPYDGEWARKAVYDWEGEDRDRALTYINHREARYNFLIANGMFEDIDAEPNKSFIDEVKEFLGI